MGINYVFQVTPLRHPETLIPQLSHALRLYAQLDARRHYPFLWKILDHFSLPERIRRSSPLLPLFIWLTSLCLLLPTLLCTPYLVVPLSVSSLCFAVAMACLWRYCRMLLAALSLSTGVLLTWGALCSPTELGTLLPFGILGLAVGLAALLFRRLPAKPRAVRTAEALVRRYTALLDKKILEVAFSTEKMVLFSFLQNAPDIPIPEQSVPYANISYLVETAELLLLIYENAVLLLQKQDLVTGSLDRFLHMMAQKTTLVKAI